MAEPRKKKAMTLADGLAAAEAWDNHEDKRGAPGTVIARRYWSQLFHHYGIAFYQESHDFHVEACRSRRHRGR
jgi:hypothetical protein